MKKIHVTFSNNGAIVTNTAASELYIHDAIERLDRAAMHFGALRDAGKISDYVYELRVRPYRKAAKAVIDLMATFEEK